MVKKVTTVVYYQGSIHVVINCDIIDIPTFYDSSRVKESLIDRLGEPIIP